MLSAAHRLTDVGSFRLATRSGQQGGQRGGQRAGSRTVVVHLTLAPRPRPARVGFVVSRAVGNAVIRNRVKRRLRHLCREHVSVLPISTLLVVRALPAAAGASYQELGADLTRCLERVLS